MITTDLHEEHEDRRRHLLTLSEAWSAAVVPLFLFLAVAIAATAWLPAYQVGGADAYLVVAALVPVVIATVLGEYLGQPPALSYGASLVFLVALLLVLGAGDPATAWHGLTVDPTRLLTETLPLAGHAELLVAPVALTWIAGAAATEVWLRARSNPAALAIPVALFVLAYAASSAAPGAGPAGGPYLLGVLTILAVIRRRRTEARRGVVKVSPDSGSESDRSRLSAFTPALRATSVGVALAVVVAAVVGVAVPALPGLGGHRAAVARPTSKNAGLLLDPVDAIASLRNSGLHRPAQPQFSVATSGAAPGYFGVATLDDYDGGSWTFDRTFHPTGGRIPSARGTSVATAATAARAVSQDFRFDPTYQLPYLPAMDRPSQVHGMAVAADEQTGMILPSEPGTLPQTYRALSRTPDATLAGVPAAERVVALAPTSGAVPAADTAIPAGTRSDLATATKFLASLTGEKPEPTVAFLQDVEHALASSEHRIDPAAAPTAKDSVPDTTGGTSLAQVINSVGVVRAATPEQFATFFAVVARYLGVPARLVTGFRVPTAGGDGGVLPAGNHVVTNREAWTWVEIPVAGLGWVIADPTPAAAVAAPKPPAEQAQAIPPAGLPAHQANAVPRKQFQGGHAIAKPVHLHLPHATHHSPVDKVLLGAAGLLLVLLLAGPGLAALRRLARRWARRSGAPAAQTIGAWLELLDTFTRYGMATPDGATAAEVAADAGRHFGADVVAPVEELGALADRALFSTTAAPDAPGAARAWKITGQVRDAVAATQDRRRRARALLAVGDAPRRPVGAKG